MDPRRPIRPTHRLVILFAALTLVPSALLVAFGWRLLQQDRVIALADMQARRLQTANLVVTSLEQTITEAERRLREPENAAATLEHGAAVALLDPHGVTALPRGRVLYYPVSPSFPEPRPGVFEALDAAEYRSGDRDTAIKIARDLASSAQPLIRAVALIRLARNLRARGDLEGALRTYLEAATITDVGLNEVPVALFARWARCGLLEELGRGEQLRIEGAALHDDLLRGQWVLVRSVFELHLADAARWAGTASKRTATAEQRQMTAVLEQVFTQHRSGGLRPPYRGTITADGSPFTLLLVEHDGRTAAMMASREYVERHWMTKAAAVVDGQGLRVADAALGRATSDGAIVRTAVETGLPWSLVVEPTDALTANRLARRQSLWLAGLVVLAALSLAGTMIVARAVNRELAVARLQSDFVAAVSHEFRTPLTTMSQLTEVLIDGRADDQARRLKYYEALARQTQRLRRLVENLLDFARMEAGGEPYRFQTFEVASWARGVIAQFVADGASRNHQVHLDLPAETVNVAGDKEALTTALWNLLDNAAKYSPGAEHVWVTFSIRDARLLISVHDAGVGIPADEHGEIFGKFVRGRRARADNIKGTGIGLAMVRHTVDGHGGTVTVSSSERGGTTFTISLPGASVPQVPPTAGTEPVDRALGAAPARPPVAAEHRTT